MAGKFWARCGGQGRGAKKKLDYFHKLGSIATDCWFSTFSNQPSNVKNVFSDQQLVINI
jgi:hypothetical protein